MDKHTPKETSKGAEEIVLTQIKQDFITPANAIFDYVDMVEKILNDADLESEDEIEQIKSSCSKLIDQYEVAFVQNTGVNADSSKKSAEAATKTKTIPKRCSSHKNDNTATQPQNKFKAVSEFGMMDFKIC